MQVGFKALEIIADNKPLLEKKNPKEDANLKNPTSTNIKKEEKPAKKDEAIPKFEPKPEKKEENTLKHVSDTKIQTKKEETILVKDRNEDAKDKIEENSKKSSDLRADVKNSESEADRVKRLVDETTRKTNDVKRMH